MSRGVFTDKNGKPDINEIYQALSAAKPLFESLVNHIESNFRTHGELKFYGKNYGWALRFKKSGKALVSLYPGENEFTAQVILDGRQVSEALNSEISPALKNIIKDTPEIYEGKWIFIKTNSSEMAGDIEKLILIRSGKL